MRRGTRFAPALLAALLGAAAPVSAQMTPVQTGAPAPVPGTDPLTLTESLRRTLDQAPVVQRARQDIRQQEGAARQARGAFDLTVVFGPGFEHRENDIEYTGFYDPERVKRGFAAGLKRAFGLIATDLGRQLSAGRGDLPLCPTDGSYGSYFVTLPGTALSVPVCRPLSTTQPSGSLDDPDGLFNFRQALPFDPISSLDLQLLLGSAFRVQIATASLEARERSAELLLVLQTAARSVETKAGLVEQRLGLLPEYVYSNQATLKSRITKPLRSGTLFELSAQIAGRATLFRDKPIDPKFGGTDEPNQFQNRLELAWVQPLARGRGRGLARAAEDAARRSLEASTLAFQQTAADQALATVDAYLELLEAQQSRDFNQQSLTTQRRLLDETVRRVGAGDLPAVDIARARARMSTVTANLEASQQAVTSAQARLAEVMGTTGTDVLKLAASDAFPATPASLDDAERLTAEARTRRADLRALTAFAEASRILMAGARNEARTRFDVRLSGGASQRYFGPIFHSLGFENGEQLTNDLYVPYYSATGFGRAFRERWQPFFLVSGTIDLPFRNNRRLGRLAESTATARESEIRAVNLDRTIRNDVPRVVVQLERLQDEWAQQQDVVINYEATLNDTLRLWGAGELTLIDTLLTEQQLTDARLRLAQIRRSYASALARLRRETGSLVTFADAAATQPQLNLTGIVDGR